MFMLTSSLAIEWFTATVKETAIEEFDEVKKQRDAFIILIEHLRAIVDAKLKRFISVISGSPSSKFKPHHFGKALSPKEQIALMVQFTHKYFSDGSAASDQIQLAIYKPSDDEKRLELLASTDGKDPLTLDSRIAQFMRIGHADGARTEAIKAYNKPGDTVIRVVEDCRKQSLVTERDGTKSFEYLYPDQEKELGSLVVFKHKFDSMSSSQALIITIAAKKLGNFKEKDEEVYKSFLTEIAKRIEFELVSSRLCPDEKPVSKKLPRASQQNVSTLAENISGAYVKEKTSSGREKIRPPGGDS